MCVEAGYSLGCQNLRPVSAQQAGCSASYTTAYQLFERLCCQIAGLVRVSSIRSVVLTGRRNIKTVQLNKHLLTSRSINVRHAHAFGARLSSITLKSCVNASWSLESCRTGLNSQIKTTKRSQFLNCSVWTTINKRRNLYSKDYTHMVLIDCFLTSLRGDKSNLEKK
jgi:hypothetical protein